MTEEYHVWLWYKWEFGRWNKVFSGTKEECEAYKQKHYPDVPNTKCKVSTDKPMHDKFLVGRAYGSYARW